jgi:hypothetical protein
MRYFLKLCEKHQFENKRSDMIEIIKYAKKFFLRVIGRVEETFRAIFLNSYIVYNLSRVAIYVTSITSKSEYTLKSVSMSVRPAVNTITLQRLIRL